MRATTAAVAFACALLLAAPAEAHTSTDAQHAVASCVAMQRYLFDPATKYSDPPTGLFRFGGSTDLLGQAAFVQLYAHLALTESGAAGSRSPQPATASTPRE